MSGNDPYRHDEVGPDGSAGADISQDVRGMQVVGVSLMMGCAFFGAIVLFLRGFSSEIYKGAGILTWLGLGVAVVLLMLSFVIPSSIGARSANSIAEHIGVFRSKTIVGMSLCEGGAFFNLIAYMVDEQLIGLGATALLMGRIAMQLPTVGGVTYWMRERMRSVEQGF